MSVMKILNHRFNLNVSMNTRNLPVDSNLKEDIKLIENKAFYTLKDIAVYLNLTYPTICGIYNQTTENAGKKWINRSMCPTINITKI